MLAGLALTGTAAPVRFDFRFSHGGFAEDDIFDSGTSTPSRYMIEICRRLARAEAAADWLAVGNPLLPLTAAQLAQWLGRSPPRPAIFCDPGGFPVFYLLPRQALEAEKLLLLLSTTDARLDAMLLERIAGVAFMRVALPIPQLDSFPAYSKQGWLNPDKRLATLKLQAESALEIMDSRADWRSLPFALFHPYHAGDTLFVALASHRADPRFYDEHIVCKAFLDVVNAASPPLRPVALEADPLPRDGSVGKYSYFVNALTHLAPEYRASRFIIFGRLMRMYHFTPFHLADHARFTLGDPLDSFERTLYAEQAPPRQCPSLTGPGLRILFHLTGGWALKSYPPTAAKRLFALLASFGHEVLVLDRPDLEVSGARSVTAPTTAALSALLDETHLFVGVDSYPLHYAALVRRRPAIALFGSTKPCNSDSARRPGYRALLNELSCNPCLSKSSCPINGAETCANYVDPGVVASEIGEMAAALYGLTRPGLADSAIGAPGP